MDKLCACNDTYMYFIDMINSAVVYDVMSVSIKHDGSMVSLTDHPQSSCNRFFGDVFGLSLDFLFLTVWGFCHRTKSDLFPFL